MSIQFRLTVMNFMQFFVWGSWLISLGAYMIITLGFTGGHVGSIYATMGLGSLFMPGLMGIVADRWVNAERVYSESACPSCDDLSSSMAVRFPSSVLAADSVRRLSCSRTRLIGTRMRTVRSLRRDHVLVEVIVK